MALSFLPGEWTKLVYQHAERQNRCSQAEFPPGHSFLCWPLRPVEPAVMRYWCWQASSPPPAQSYAWKCLMKSYEGLLNWIPPSVFLLTLYKDARDFLTCLGKGSAAAPAPATALNRDPQVGSKGEIFASKERLLKATFFCLRRNLFCFSRLHLLPTFPCGLWNTLF